jgi:diguanylate cyclase
MSSGALPVPTRVIADELRRAMRRSHVLRALGLGLGAVMVGTVLYRHHAPAPVWGLLALYVLVWPHAAWLLARRSERPVAADRRWMAVDAAMMGVWIALMQFNLLPSVLLAVMFAMTLVAIGGGALLLRGTLVQVLACGITAALNGLAAEPVTGIPELLAAIPLLVVFPMALSVIMYGLSQRVRQQNRVLREMSSIDGLSGLFNRRHWEGVVDALLAARHRPAAVMLLIDIDHFKRVNDQHGHTAGDDVIRMVGATIRTSLREGDLAGRYGGDEFCVVLRDIDAIAAERVAERIRSRIACSLLENVPGLHCTVSIGVAQDDPEFRSVSDWVKEADGALYRAKLAGRNGFAVAS